MPLVCREIFNEICLLATGDIVCSCIDREGLFVLGNIYQNRVYEIFHGERASLMRNIVLSSGMDSFCPALGCNCSFKSIPEKNQKNEMKKLTIDKIRLETISYCNLRCPECIVTEWYKGEWRNTKHPRLGRLSLEKIKEVFQDTKASLKDIWFYNYGEPFLDNNFPEILGSAREIVLKAFLYTHTNGTVIPQGWIEKIVEEVLLDSISFSIDGATQETFAKYRVGGDFSVAFHNMTELQHLKKKYGKSKPDVIWQYILFEWNDSDEELRRAQELAQEHGLNIQWILTHTSGKSSRYTQGSEEYQKLQGVKHYSSNILASQTDKKYHQ